MVGPAGTSVKGREKGAARQEGFALCRFMLDSVIPVPG